MTPTPDGAARWLGIILLAAIVAALVALLAFGLIRVGLWAL